MLLSLPLLLSDRFLSLVRPGPPPPVPMLAPFPRCLYSSFESLKLAGWKGFFCFFFPFSSHLHFLQESVRPESLLHRDLGLLPELPLKGNGQSSHKAPERLPSRVSVDMSTSAP